MTRKPDNMILDESVTLRNLPARVLAARAMAPEAQAFVEAMRWASPTSPRWRTTVDEPEPEHLITLGDMN